MTFNPFEEYASQMEPEYKTNPEKWTGGTNFPDPLMGDFREGDTMAVGAVNITEHERLMRDKERLDWMEANLIDFAIYDVGSIATERWTIIGDSPYAGTWREQIDDAMGNRKD